MKQLNLYINRDKCFAVGNPCNEMNNIVQNYGYDYSLRGLDGSSPNWLENIIFLENLYGAAMCPCIVIQDGATTVVSSSRSWCADPKVVKQI